MGVGVGVGAWVGVEVGMGVTLGVTAGVGGAGDGMVGVTVGVVVGADGVAVCVVGVIAGVSLGVMDGTTLGATTLGAALVATGCSGVSDVCADGSLTSGVRLADGVVGLPPFREHADSEISRTGMIRTVRTFSNIWIPQFYKPLPLDTDKSYDSQIFSNISPHCILIV